MHIVQVTGCFLPKEHKKSFVQTDVHNAPYMLDTDRVEVLSSIRRD